jgi:lysozyme
MHLRLLLFLFLLSWTACEKNTARLDEYEVHGIDVSRYQGVVNWSEAAKAPIDFVFVKATEGASLQDSFFRYNWEQIQLEGLKRGAYHFFRPLVPVEEQVRNFTSTVDLKEGDLAPVLDVELTEGVSQAYLIQAVRTWLELVEQHYNIRPIVYTNAKFYHRYLHDYLDGYPLWIARYHHSEPPLPPGRQWTFWQYGDRGSLPGIVGDVDFNVFRGTRPELELYCVPPRYLLSKR